MAEFTMSEEEARQLAEELDMTVEEVMQSAKILDESTLGYLIETDDGIELILQKEIDPRLFLC